MNKKLEYIRIKAIAKADNGVTRERPFELNIAGLDELQDWVRVRICEPFVTEIIITKSVITVRDIEDAH